jgi:hypothetical protein
MENYKDKPFGFDRTQMFKEFESPQIHRMSALTSALKFYETNCISYTPLELKSLTLGILNFVEHGDSSVFTRFNEYLEKKEEESKKQFGQLIDG